ncbi:hypothetical protein EBT25_00210 [bacterium]|jgi:hypothetical protein|nr:hypothetical protein [bacterium]
MAAYKEEAGAILQPGNQINRLSSYNTEGVYGWPGIEAFELIGYVKIDNLAADKASFKSFDIIVPSPDRRPDDRVRDNRTSLVVQASSDRPAYIYGASIAIGQDIPAGGLAGFPAAPVTCAIGGTSTEGLLLGPNNGGSPFGVPSSQANGLAAASSIVSATSSLFAQGLSDTTIADLPFTTGVTTAGIVAADFANSMFYRVTADTTFKVFNVNGVTSTTVDGDGVFISSTDKDAGKAGYIICRVNYLRPAAAVAWEDINEYIDFASQVGGTDS